MPLVPILHQMNVLHTWSSIKEPFQYFSIYAYAFQVTCRFSYQHFYFSSLLYVARLMPLILDFIILILFDKVYKSCSSSLCSFS